LQILSALKFGRVISIDIEKTIHGGKQPVGKYILSKYPYEQLITDVTQWIAMTGEQADLIFEDTAHSQETTYKIYKHAERVLSPGGVIISHDACHPKFKGAVVAGIKQAGIKPNVYLVDGDSCGFAIWQKPKTQLIIHNASVDIGEVAEVEITSVNGETEIHAPILPDETEAIPEVPKKTTKRKRRKKAPKKLAIEEV